MRYLSSFNISEAYLKLGKLKMSERYFKKAKAMKLPDIGLYELEAFLAYRQGRYSQARRTYTRLLRAKQKQEYYWVLGNMASKEYDFSTAISMYKRALRFERDPELILNLVHMLFESDKEKEARTLWKKYENKEGRQALERYPSIKKALAQ